MKKILRRIYNIKNNKYIYKIYNECYGLKLYKKYFAVTHYIDNNNHHMYKDNYLSSFDDYEIAKLAFWNYKIVKYKGYSLYPLIHICYRHRKMIYPDVLYINPYNGKYEYLDKIKKMIDEYE